MYETVPSTELKCYHRYVIRCGLTEYFIGTSMGLKNDLAIFWNVEAVYPDGSVCWIPSRHKPSFSTNSTFKRIVGESEYKRALQNAFERRAVNQIIESKIGFKIYY